MDCTFKNTIKCEDVVEILDSDDDLFNNNNVGEKSSSRRKKCQRKVTLDTVNKTENLIITQRVEVKKRTFKCVINFNTNVSDYNCNGQNKTSPKNNTGQRSLGDRIVPTCWRLRCKGAYHRKQVKLRDDERREKKKICKCKQRNNGNRRRPHKERRDHTINKNIKHSKHHSNIDETHFKECDESNLSPISMSPLKSEDNVSYEEISMDSLTSWSNSNLDTLIKRTREREKQHFAFKKCLPLRNNAPQSIIEISSDNDSFEEKISIHSEPTLILEQPSDNSAHSPINSYDSDEKYHKMDECDFQNISKAVDSAYYEDQTSMKDAFISDTKLFDCPCDNNDIIKVSPLY